MGSQSFKLLQRFKVLNYYNALFCSYKKNFEYLSRIKINLIWILNTNWEQNFVKNFKDSSNVPKN